MTSYSTEKKQSKSVTWSESTKKCRLTVEYGMTYLKGNSQPYFSITANEEYMTRYGWRTRACGCMHEEIARRFPELKELIPYHLSGQDGLPMHYIANAKYWAQQGNWEVTYRLIRLAPDEFKPTEVNDLEMFEQWLEVRIPRLKQDFDAMMSKHGVEYIEI